MADVKLKGVTKIYANGIKAIDDLNLSIDDKEFIVLVGPSGCGKSTILRLIAGLETPTGGDIYINGTRVNDVSPKDRDISMVFQDFALYPHMNVYDNIAFGMKMRRVPREEIKNRVNETARVLGIEGLLQRKPKQISGGERQRVALGRAIVRNPRVFLMDEPLSNLDAKLRSQMRIEIHRLYRTLNNTIIYVTHDQTEAMTMGTRIAILKDGIIQQIDTPREVYANPLNTFVASFIGTPSMNLIRAKITEEKEGVKLQFPDGALIIPAESGKAAIAAGYSNTEIIAGIRPEHIHINCIPLSGSCGLTGEIEVVENLGAESCVSLITRCGNITAKVPSESAPVQGESVFLDILPERVHLFDATSGKRITKHHNG
jgi:multiple sugar transport system ATP-binding protein